MIKIISKLHGAILLRAVLFNGKDHWACCIAFTLIIASYVWSELQVNRNLKNADDQYIIQSKWKDQTRASS